MHSPFPTTNFIVWLLQKPRSRKEAGQQARQLKIRLDYAEFYWRTVRK